MSDSWVVFLVLLFIPELFILTLVAIGVVNGKGLLVGVKGFEPSASCSRSKRSARLSYTPTVGMRLGSPLAFSCQSLTAELNGQAVRPWQRRPA